MCGIVGYIGKDKCIPKIISGLESLEYRGYDSAGIAYKVEDQIVLKKAEGRISNLKKIINMNVNSYLGIGHTRWATHGKPCKINSHPHKVGKITLVHNGIIENYEQIKLNLSEYSLQSETDSEVVAALIDKLYGKTHNMLKVLNYLKDYLKGSYALGILNEDDNKLYAIRKDSPLIIGISDDGYFIASDVPAILKYTNKYCLLLNDEYAVLDSNKINVFTGGKLVKKNILQFDGTCESAMKNGYEHFMLKEIYEQDKVVLDIINFYINDITRLNEVMEGLENYDAIDIVGCGSAYHVGLVGKSLITKYGKIVVNVEVASEYRYGEHIYSNNHLIIVISQSGETADTLAVLRQAKKLGIKTLAIVNVPGSTISREADKVIYTKAGMEIAVATTKAYTCQLLILSLIALYLGIKRGILPENIIDEYKLLSNYIKKILNNHDDVKEVAELIYKNNNIFYLGRQIDYALAMEASLKLKEVSYIHSEAYAAGELKHGTISLIEEGMPVLSIITDEKVRDKTLSNVKEVCARGALSIIITNQIILDKTLYTKIVNVPKINDLVESILIVIKCQLISYYVAKLRNCDIDKPRNLAKSVTVE